MIWSWDIKYIPLFMVSCALKLATLTISYVYNQQYEI